MVTFPQLLITGKSSNSCMVPFSHKYAKNVLAQRLILIIPEDPLERYINLT
jgi:hypothetical protein